MSGSDAGSQWGPSKHCQLKHHPWPLRVGSLPQNIVAGLQGQSERDEGAKDERKGSGGGQGGEGESDP